MLTQAHANRSLLERRHGCS